MKAEKYEYFSASFFYFSCIVKVSKIINKGDFCYEKENKEQEKKRKQIFYA